MNHKAIEIVKYPVKNITIREYYAGLFMQALLTNTERHKYISQLVNNEIISHEKANAKNAHKAVLLADALLEELSKQNN